jgi:hypothetical protein
VKRRWPLVLALALPLAFASACGDSVQAPVADEEPLRFGYVIGSTTFRAQFFTGDLPQPSGGPAVAGVDIGPNQASPGTQGKSGYVVRVDDHAYSVAVRLQGRTNGYWIARVNQVEAINAAQVSASLVFDVAPSVAPGRYNLEISGVDGEHRYGERTLAPLEIVPRIPVNASAVITLRWDAAVDLDLQVRAPDGTLLSPKRPTTEPIGTPDAGTAAGVGRLYGDSMASCVDDGRRQEDVVFTTPPLSGSYSIFVNAFSLCRKSGTNYDVSVIRGGNVDQRFFGRISDLEVQQGGFNIGDFVAEISF